MAAARLVGREQLPRNLMRVCVHAYMTIKIRRMRDILRTGSANALLSYSARKAKVLIRERTAAANVLRALAQFR